MKKTKTATRARTIFILGTIAATSLFGSSASGRENPLSIITDNADRAELVIVLDTSGSMTWDPATGAKSGVDCSGDRTGTVDLCGDGLCSGTEGLSQNPCPADCAGYYERKGGAKVAPRCRASSPTTSRMVMVKRELKNLLPEMRGSLNAGLVTFWNDDYFRYFKATTTPTQLTSTKLIASPINDLDGGGALLAGESQVSAVSLAATDLTKSAYSGAPAAGLTAIDSYASVDALSDGNTDPDAAAKIQRVTFYMTHTEMERAGAWDAAADRPREQFKWFGTNYVLLSGAGLPVTADSLYARVDDISVENRFPFATAGLTYSDGTHTWKFKGAFYTFSAATHNVRQSVKLPEFVDEYGQTWVYNRYGSRYSSGVSVGNTGAVMVGLETAQTQAAQDQNLYQIMGLLNQSIYGGLYARGGTPTGKAIGTARDHYLARQAGTGMFYTAGPDPKASCRPRFVLVLTDGESTGTVNPGNAVASMYNHASFAGNPVKTLVVGLPGLKSSAIAELDHMADAGDDGQLNGSRTAYYAANEHGLNKVLQLALLEVISGDYSTTAAGVTKSENSYVAGNMVLLPTTAYPEWRGKLRAIDFSTSPNEEKWEAGDLLSKRDYTTRALYTGYPESASGAPVPLMSSGGVVNLHAIKSVWAEAGTVPDDNTVKAVVEWIAGKDRDWKLGPILRSVPSVVGPPPTYKNIPGRSSFASTYAARERLVYITSNDGVLHAFRAKSGQEAFAYVPPHLWPAIHTLWIRGGQSPVVSRFDWLLASSPRIEDVPPAAAPGSWATHLTLTMGPGGTQMVTLDITEPTACTATGCPLKAVPFRVVSHSRSHANSTLLGETWSTPAYFYSVGEDGQTTGHMAMGGGYGAGGKGEHYSFYASLYGTQTTKHHLTSSNEVDYAVLADSVAATNMENGRKVIATYQADLVGRLVRYDLGDSASASVLVNAGAQKPIYFSPAVYHRGGGKVSLAFASGSANEESPISGGEATLYLRTEQAGTVDPSKDYLSCNVSDLCSLSPGCPLQVPADCTAPGASAMPVGSPIIVDNEVAKDTFRLEAFYLLYEPPASDCATGSTYLVRVATAGDTEELLSVKKYDGIRGTGLTLVGGGQNMAITGVDQATRTARAFTIDGKVLTANQDYVVPAVEIWKEVR